MKDELQQKAIAYLQDHNVMTLSTFGPEGLWAAAVFYVNDGFTLYYLSASTSRHSINIEAHSGIAATVQEDYDDWPDIKGVQLEGDAFRVEGWQKAQAIKLYGMKFPIVGNLSRAPQEIVKAFRKIDWYKVEPSRLYFIDNSRGFGHRDQIHLPYLDK